MAKRDESTKSSQDEDKVKGSGQANAEPIADGSVGSNTDGPTVKELVADKEIQQEEKRQEQERVSALPLKDQKPIDQKKPIQSEEDALALIKREYKAPEGIKSAHVTEDGNVFWPENGSSAYSHAVRNNIKLFNVSWD